jgi:DNA-binding MarR family transcriptional regulator
MDKKNASLDRFSQELMGLMLQLVRGFARYEHRFLMQGALTPVQFWGLDYLLGRGACPMKDFSAYLGVSKPSATALIGRLITQGLVVRLHDKQDGRIVRIMLSARGRKLTAGIKEQRYRMLSFVFGKINESDRREYLRILKEIVRVLRSA